MKDIDDPLKIMLEQLRRSFLDELPEKIDRIETLLLEMENNGSSSENFNEVYRIVHSLKGSGGTFGLHVITAISHQFEDLLNITEGGRKLDSSRIALSLEYLDLLRQAGEQIESAMENYSQIEKQLVMLRSRLIPKLFSVLLANGSKLEISFCMQALSQLPVHVAVVKDGLQALVRATSEPFDLMISANAIPYISGSAVIAALKLSDPRFSRIRTILLTSDENLMHSDRRDTDADYTILKDGNLMSNLFDAVKRSLALPN